MILTQSQAEAVDKAMTALNNAGAWFTEISFPGRNGAEVRTTQGRAFLIDDGNVGVERYAEQVEFQKAYGLQIDDARGQS